MDKVDFNGAIYFKVPLHQLRGDEAIDFPLYVLMRINVNIVLRYSASAFPTKTELDNYIKKGLTHFVCPEEFYSRWLVYAAKNKNQEEPKGHPSSPEIFRSIEAAQTMTPEEKKKELISIGEKMLGILSDVAKSPPEKKWEALRECQAMTNSIVRIGLQSHKMRSVYEDIEMLQKSSIEHTAAVATMSVIFALTLGYVDEIELAEISMGALMHDLGHALMPPRIFDKPYSKFSEDDLRLYHEHPLEGAQLMEEFGDDVGPLVKQIVLQHHERFDGGGFPKKMRGFEIDERVQVVALADVVCDMMKGKMTGTEMSPMEAFDDLKRRQTASGEQLVTFEIFEGLHQVLKKTKPADVTAKAPAA